MSPKPISLPRKTEAAGLARRVSSDFTFFKAITSPPSTPSRLPDATVEIASTKSAIQSEDIAAEGGDATTSGTATDAPAGATSDIEALEDITNEIDLPDTQASPGVQDMTETQPAKANNNKRKRKNSLENAEGNLGQYGDQLSAGMAIALRRSKKAKLAEEAAQKSASTANTSRRPAATKEKKGAPRPRPKPQPKKGKSKPKPERNPKSSKRSEGQQNTTVPNNEAPSNATDSDATLGIPPIPDAPRHPSLPALARCAHGHEDQSTLYCLELFNSEDRCNEWLVAKPDWVPLDLWECTSPWVVNLVLRYIRDHKRLPTLISLYTPTEWRIVEMMCVWVKSPGKVLRRKGMYEAFPRLEEVEQKCNVEIPEEVKRGWKRAKADLDPKDADGKKPSKDTKGKEDELPTRPTHNVDAKLPIKAFGEVQGTPNQSGLSIDASQGIHGDQIATSSDGCKVPDATNVEDAVDDKSGSVGDREISAPPTTDGVSLAEPATPPIYNALSSPQRCSPRVVSPIIAASPEIAQANIAPAAPISFTSPPLQAVYPASSAPETISLVQPGSEQPKSPLEFEAEFILTALCPDSRLQILAAATNRRAIIAHAFPQVERRLVQRFKAVMEVLTNV